MTQVTIHTADDLPHEDAVVIGFSTSKWSSEEEDATLVTRDHCEYLSYNHDSGEWYFAHSEDGDETGAPDWWVHPEELPPPLAETKQRKPEKIETAFERIRYARITCHSLEPLQSPSEIAHAVPGDIAISPDALKAFGNQRREAGKFAYEIPFPSFRFLTDGGHWIWSHHGERDNLTGQRTYQFLVAALADGAADAGEIAAAIYRALRDDLIRSDRRLFSLHMATVTLLQLQDECRAHAPHSGTVDALGRDDPCFYGFAINIDERISRGEWELRPLDEPLPGFETIIAPALLRPSIVGRAVRHSITGTYGVVATVFSSDVFGAPAMHVNTGGGMDPFVWYVKHCELMKDQRQAQAQIEARS